MGIQSRIKRWTRGGIFLLRSIFWEKPRGLDFSLRKKKRGIKAEGSHGYALTQKKAFDAIMDRLDIEKTDRFIDIGCGKGGTLYYASEYPFGRIAGVEIEDSLYEVAVENFKKLKMPDIEIFHDNALTFKRYNEFNIFYLFNPFDDWIYRGVIDRICEAFANKTEADKVYLICYGASVTDYIQEKHVWEIISEYEDPVRETNVHIWKLRV